MFFVVNLERGCTFVSINLEVLKRVSTFLWINLESLEVMDMDIFVDKT